MPTNNKIILGFTGLMAGGKGTAAKYLEEKHGAATFRFSTMLRDALDRFYLEHSRDNMIKMSEIMRGTYGEDIMAKTMAHDVGEADKNLIMVDGIRRMADIEHLKQMPNFVLVEIFADPKTRHERLVQRGENTDDTSKTYEQFLEDHNRSTEQSILEVITHANEKVDNNGNYEDLYKQLDDLVNKYAS
ncbi:AAA family ATPase [Patescibacteria group bacterium]|nr:AAA family ATPase [Patescibacteria group bacterium]MBU1895963.1 AAA family ATPase [Patescibacteria group bacterium]